MAIQIAQLYAKLGVDSSEAQAGISGFARMLAPGGMAGLALGAAGVAIAGVGIAATKMAGDFQEGLTQLVTGAGESQANLGMISDGILKMAVDTGESTKQLTDGLYMIESAGYHGAQGLQILQAAAEGAKVGGADLGTVADATTTILKDFGNTGINANQAVNALVATVSAGKTHMSDLASSLSQILPTASAAGVGLSDVMGAMATMTAEGVPAAEAATYLRQTIIALQAPSSASKKMLEDIGLSTSEVADAMHQSLPDALQLITDHLAKKFPVGSAAYLAALKDIAGGSKQMQGLLDLTGQHLSAFDANALQVGHDVHFGANSINGWALVQQDFNQKIARAKEVVETLMIQLGQHLLPVVGKLVDVFASRLPGAVNAVTGAFSGLSNGNKQLNPLLQAAASFFKDDLEPAATQFATFAVKTLVPAVKQIAEWFAQHVLPIVLQVAGIFVSDVLPAVEDVAGAILTKLVPPLERLWNLLSPMIVPVFQLLGSILKNVVGPGLVQVIGIVGWLIDRLDDLLTILKPVTDLIGKLDTAMANGLNNLPSLLKGLPHFASGGQMPESGWALVGENGPELVRLPGGAQVYPNPAGVAGGGTPVTSSGGSGTQVIVVQIDGKQAARAIAPHMPNVLSSATGARHL